MSDIWTIQAALAWTENYLKHKGDENPRLSSQWLLSHATGLSRIELYARFDQPLSMPERDILRDIVARRGSGEPLQYISGEVGFRHIMLKIRSGVLIPRPETEVLVSEALAMLPSLSLHEEAQDVLVADLCTGSGCIACSIAHEYPSSTLIATDISPEAIALAQENAESLGLAGQIECILSDLGTKVPASMMGHFHVVVSNPPYIPTQILEDIPREVSEFEPQLALDGGEDGLDVFRKIVLWASEALVSGGALVVELHETCLQQAAQFVRETGFDSPHIVLDLAGRERVLVASRTAKNEVS